MRFSRGYSLSLAQDECRTTVVSRVLSDFIVVFLDAAVFCDVYQMVVLLVGLHLVFSVCACSISKT